eukprot:scaffold303199_cov36-Prasinocladus_malaysianus.AAC.1
MRAARVVPENDPPALAQFFFDTELNEMEYECTRCRPHLVSIPQIAAFQCKESYHALAHSDVCEGALDVDC